MANETAINNIYNYYLTTYAPKSTTKYDAHKKSELRGVYNSIVKINKDDSLYILDKSASTREFAIGIKEGARDFRNTIASLGGLTEDEFLSKKAAYSTNERIATASYIGESISDTSLPTFSLEVNKMASPQVNTGNMLPEGNIPFPEGTYSFDVGINGFNYEFQYNVTSEDTNKSIQEKLSRLINNANIGLSSSILEDENGNTALEITSDRTGSLNGSKIFTISDDNTSKTSGSVSYLGLSNTSQMNSDSEFKINGESRHASANTFTVEKKFEITLNGISQDENDLAEITLQTDVDSMINNINDFIEGYNAFFERSEEFAKAHPKTNRLIQEMSNIAKYRAEDLSQMGLTFKEDGRFELNEGALRESVANGTIDHNFKVLQNFTGAMLKKTNEVSLNPMSYAERTLVAYKNPGHNFANPYVASPYTGMMFSSYC